ncbi:allophanate hydrolase [Cellulomonas chitinilytica]|uniref:Allophanate hydrolase n=1 Tax=Cellulomonas chitinilytica TaxID=398759 RepID=A0A919P565_9CELL|nr:allophanate hydrolase subunit 1 [Cellulomonas chitinilytica]GIG22153.1 allophanate hydrolase [Cellulomonas chitinilytica]
MTDSTGARVVAFGDDALLVEVADLAAVRRLDAALRAERADGSGPWAAVVDQVPAARTVLLRTSPGADLAELAGAVRSAWEAVAQDAADGETPAPGDATDQGSAGVVTLQVVYDGADLADVADLTGCTVDEVVARHAAPTYTVAFGGFMPGFAYLVGLDPRLHVPRRDSPRERVPAGSVAIADEYSAVYPAQTPGGWRLLGRCDVDLFDVTRTPPALLAPGTRVRFAPVTRPA